MSKYLRSRHVSLELEAPKELQEQYGVFFDETLEAGVTLRKLRETQGWTLEELGEKVGLDGLHMLAFEKGEQPIPVVLARRFAEIFHTDHHLFL